MMYPGFSGECAAKMASERRLTEKTMKTTPRKAPISLLSSNESIYPRLPDAADVEPMARPSRRNGIPHAAAAGEIARKLGLLLGPCNTYKGISE